MMALGESMYRHGILPSGKPMQALVMGDIPFDGRMFTCDNCHQRSGLGSEEGTVITWPTTGKELYIPRRRTGAFRPAAEEESQNVRRRLPEYFRIKDQRPAYTDETLARVLLTGIDSAGNKLHPIMPKYRLSKQDRTILIYYLKHLSTDFSPGVDDSTLYFATVIGPDVPEKRKIAMLSVLDAHIQAHNSLSRHEDKRKSSGPFYKTEMHKAYRKLQLNVWQLTGPESSWREQLETFYSNQPVFALLGGISEGSWEAIHAFSEEHFLPCIFPITDLPVVSDTDWYTLYFSKGYYQEGESTARYLYAQQEYEKKQKVIQIYRADEERSTMLARGFSETWKKLGGSPVKEIVINSSENSLKTEDALNQVWDTLSHDNDRMVLLAWMNKGETLFWSGIEKHKTQISTAFVSGPLLEYDYSMMTKALQSKLLITHPASLPTEKVRSRFVVEKWLEARKIPLADLDIQAKMYFLGWMLPGSIKHLRSEFYRDYFLEGYDMMIDQDYAIVNYPRLTFGPGQRYASKGCYIVRLTGDHSQAIEPVSDWSSH